MARLARGLAGPHPRAYILAVEMRDKIGETAISVEIEPTSRGVGGNWDYNYIWLKHSHLCHVCVVVWDWLGVSLDKFKKRERRKADKGRVGWQG